MPPVARHQVAADHRLPSEAEQRTGREARASMARVTLQTIADKLGVSRMTVSNAFSRPDQLSAALREKVLAAADELGYAGPDPSARALARGSTGAVGIVLTDSAITAFTDEVATRFFGAIATELAPTGLALTLVPAVEVGGQVPARDVPMDAALLYHCDPQSPALHWLQKRGLPMVLVDQYPREDTISVNVEDRSGAHAAGQHLVELGHRRIGVVAFAVRPPHGISDPTPLPTEGFGSNERMHGWLQALAAADIVPTVFRTNDPQGGAAALDALLAADPEITGVLCYSDVIASGVMTAAQQRGLEVPGDLSVVGFDNTPLAAHLQPPLTTVDQDVIEKGRIAAAAVIRLLGRATVLSGNPAEGAGEGPETPAIDHAVLPTSLVVRQSTAAPRTDSSG
jgi:DNA-binding LacI/PurR family transcriptional regulator